MVKEKCFHIDMVLGNISFTTLDVVVENHTLFVGNLQDIVKKKLAFARDEK